MKGSEAFIQTIKEYVENNSSIDVNKHPEKSIEKCVNYILTQVQKSGCNGFKDAEIFGMAVHYFDEPNEKLGTIKDLSMNVVVNHHVELTEEEKEAMKQAALDEVKRKQIESLTKRQTEKKPVQNLSNQMELF